MPSHTFEGGAGRSKDEPKGFRPGTATEPPKLLDSTIISFFNFADACLLSWGEGLVFDVRARMSRELLDILERVRTRHVATSTGDAAAQRFQRDALPYDIEEVDAPAPPTFPPADAPPPVAHELAEPVPVHISQETLDTVGADAPELVLNAIESMTSRLGAAAVDVINYDLRRFRGMMDNISSLSRQHRLVAERMCSNLSRQVEEDAAYWAGYEQQLEEEEEEESGSSSSSSDGSSVAEQADPAASEGGGGGASDYDDGRWQRQLQEQARLCVASSQLTEMVAKTNSELMGQLSALSKKDRRFLPEPHPYSSHLTSLQWMSQVLGGFVDDATQLMDEGFKKVQRFPSFQGAAAVQAVNRRTRRFGMWIRAYALCPHLNRTQLNWNAVVKECNDGMPTCIKKFEVPQPATRGIAEWRAYLERMRHAVAQYCEQPNSMFTHFVKDKDTPSQPRSQSASVRATQVAPAPTPPQPTASAGWGGNGAHGGWPSAPQATPPPAAQSGGWGPATGDSWGVGGAGGTWNVVRQTASSPASSNSVKHPSGGKMTVQQAEADLQSGELFKLDPNERESRYFMPIVKSLANKDGVMLKAPTTTTAMRVKYYERTRELLRLPKFEKQSRDRPPHASNPGQGAAKRARK